MLWRQGERVQFQWSCVCTSGPLCYSHPAGTENISPNLSILWDYSFKVLPEVTFPHLFSGFVVTETFNCHYQKGKNSVYDKQLNSVITKPKTNWFACTLEVLFQVTSMQMNAQIIFKRKSYLQQNNQSNFHCGSLLCPLSVHKIGQNQQMLHVWVQHRWVPQQGKIHCTANWLLMRNNSSLVLGTGNTSDWIISLWVGFT